MSLRSLKPDERIQLGDTARMAQVPNRFARITAGWCTAWIGRSVADYARSVGLPAEDCVRRMEPDAQPRNAWEVGP